MITTSTNAPGHGGLITFLDRTLAEFARLAWALCGVRDPSVVTLPRDRPANRGAR